LIFINVNRDFCETIIRNICYYSKGLPTKSLLLIIFVIVWQFFSKNFGAQKISSYRHDRA